MRAPVAWAVALLVLCGGGSARAQSPSAPLAPLRLALPGEARMLELAAPDFALAQHETPASGRQRYLLAVDRRGGATLSILLDRIPEATSATACRDHYWASLQARSPLKMDDVRLSAAGDLATLEYMVHEVRGIRVEQKHVNHYHARAGVCVDVHVSKVEFVPADDARLRVVAGAAILAERRPVPPGTERRRYAISDKESLTLEVPAGWEPSFARPTRGNPLTLAVSAAGPSAASIQVSFITGRAGDLGADVARGLRALTERTGRVPLAHAVEPALTLEELGGGVPGYFYQLTDKAPGPGGYRYLLQGIAMAGEVILTFTVLSHARDIPEIPATLLMIRSARPE